MIWKVVIVEDEDLLRNGLIQAIPWRELGFEVVGEADNGKRGLEVIWQTRPHVVFSDIKMAQMDGLTMAEKVHEWDPNIRIVFISGYDEFAYAMRALKVGAVEYILKPIQLEQVESILKNLAEKLNSELNQQREYDKLKLLEEQNLNRVRQDFYRSVIYGSEAERENNPYQSLMPPEELEGCFCVLIAEQMDFAAVSMSADYIAIMEMDHTFEGALGTSLEELKDCTLVRGSACERIIVLRGSDREDTRQKIDLCKKLLQGIHDTGSEYQLDEGKPEYGIDGLFRSYLAARKAGEERYQEEWNQIFKREKEGIEGIHFINYDKTPLIQAIKSGNREKIEEEYANLEATLANQKVFSHIHLILIVTSIFEELIKLPAEMGRVLEEISGKPMEDYQKIISKGKRSEILEGLKEYCFMLGEHFGETRETKLQSSLKRAISYMHQEYGNEDLMMGDVAKYAYISSSYLSLLLKKETGKTFIEYLTDIRMEHARKLLLETNMKNYEVAQACGFANATYFSTVFKSVYGMSPSTYRKENN